MRELEKDKGIKKSQPIAQKTQPYERGAEPNEAP